jgi:hypothetical protein
MADRADANVLQILRRQPPKDRPVYLVLAERRLISFETKYLSRPRLRNQLPTSMTALCRLSAIIVLAIKGVQDRYGSIASIWPCPGHVR